MNGKFRLTPIMHGGTQEQAYRPGTENVFAIGLLGEALSENIRNRSAKLAHIRALGERLTGNLSKAGVPFERLVAAEKSSPYILTLAFPGVPSRQMMADLAVSGFCVSQASNFLCVLGRLSSGPSSDMNCMYSDGEYWHFMDPESFEQVQATKAGMGGAEKWLKGEESCVVTLWNGEPIFVQPPNFVELKITETDPGVRGDTSGGGGKPATLETGAVVRVPLFVNQDEVIRVDTRSGEYSARVK